MSKENEEELIKVFYDCFARADWKGMADCYGEDPFFYDPVFQDLQGPEVSAMWQLLLRGAKDLRVEVSDIHSDQGYGSCHWVATYTFPRTGRRVVNKGKAMLTISGGRIVEHQDDFSLWNWSRQALGLPGLLFGWTPPLQNSIRRQARRNLEKFMAKQP